MPERMWNTSMTYQARLCMPRRAATTLAAAGCSSTVEREWTPRMVWETGRSTWPQRRVLCQRLRCAFALPPPPHSPISGVDFHYTVLFYHLATELFSRLFLRRASVCHWYVPPCMISQGSGVCSLRG